MWWWLEPLFYTSIVLAIIDGIITIIVFKNVDILNDTVDKICTVICISLCIPLVITILLGLINFLTFIFYNIWSPYIT